MIYVIIPLRYEQNNNNNKYNVYIVGLENRHLSENVALHGEQKAVGICENLRGGY